MTSGARGNMVYEFGAFRVDPGERQLLRNGQPVSLTPKAFDLLVYLVEHQGHLVEKAALIAALWPDTIVEEANLAFQISALRKVLDDGTDGSSVLQTVPTRGYRFVAPITEVQLLAARQAAAEVDWALERSVATLPQSIRNTSPPGSLRAGPLSAWSRLVFLLVTIVVLVLGIKLWLNTRFDQQAATTRARSSVR